MNGADPGAGKRPSSRSACWPAMPLTNAPSEGPPLGCTCLLMAPGTMYEARVRGGVLLSVVRGRRPSRRRSWHWT